MQPDCTKRPGFLRRAFLALLVAACVLAGQSGVALHDLGHAMEPTAAAHHAPPSDGCDAPGEERDGGCPLHALFAELGSFAAGSFPSVVAAPASFEAASFDASLPRSTRRVPFRSRAPPVLPA